VTWDQDSLSSRSLFSFCYCCCTSLPLPFSSKIQRYSDMKFVLVLWKQTDSVFLATPFTFTHLVWNSLGWECWIISCVSIYLPCMCVLVSMSIVWHSDCVISPVVWVHRTTKVHMKNYKLRNWSIYWLKLPRMWHVHFSFIFVS
jgi:hypothetical protein